MKKLDELKDVVAKEMGYKNFKEAKLMQYLPNEFIKASERLAELYATEAIKADRKRIAQLCLNKATIHDGISFSCPFDVDSIHSLPIKLLN